MMRVPWAIVAALLLAAAPAAAGEDCFSAGRTAPGSSWRSLSRGLEVRDFRIEYGKGGYAEMAAVRIDPALFRVRLRWQVKEASSPAAAAPEVARRSGAAVVVNAGYFGTDGRPLGFFMSGGKLYNRRLLYRGRRRALHLGAVFFVRAAGGGLGITVREKFSPEGVREAFQAGPYLVRSGRPEAGLEAYREYHRKARRTVLALGRRGSLLVAVGGMKGRGISWCELQAFLARPEEEGGLGAAEAMNLDGGMSSQLYIRAKGYERHLEGRNVPAFILIVPRAAGAGSQTGRKKEG